MLHHEAQKTSELNAVLQQQVGDLHAELEQVRVQFIGHARNNM